MEDNFFDISFTHNDLKYVGWVNPSDRLNKDGNPASYHVVLNETHFGAVSFQDCKWSVNEDRPSVLVNKVGEQIEKHYKL
jgi:hypothetical protein